MEFERITPEAAGICSAGVEEFLDEVGRRGAELHGFMLLRGGKVCAEGSAYPYGPDIPHGMFSFSKSLTSTAIGFAQAEGLLSLDERLVDLFPDKLPETVSENLRNATVRHLLMMSCGHETEIPNLGMGDPDWIRAFLAHPFPYAPGTHFLYNTAGTNLLSAILTRKTGLPLTEFLRPRLIEPLGMGPLSCALLPDGTEMGGAGMALTLEDMARFIQFTANRGVWAGKRLLPAAWFEEATGRMIENRSPAGGDPDWQAGYGYQFWRCTPEGVYRADGAFGQFGVVFEKQDAVLVTQCATPQMQAVLTAAWTYLLPAMQDAPLPPDPAAAAHLTERLQALTLNPVLGVRNPGAEASLNGAKYRPLLELPAFTDLIGGAGRFVPDGGALTALSLRFEEDRALLVAEHAAGADVFPIGLTGRFAVGTVRGRPYGGIGRWRSRNKFEAELRALNAVTGVRFVFAFSPSGLTLTGDSTFPAAGGLCDPDLPEMPFAPVSGEIDTRTRMYWEN